ncbi:hypothetical protein [Neopusillimonas aromaticivorans]|uniref:hypothetical protein n=1 Tax=Neopusillimonas aromaticivorans TaxID=2979868 RepID=UPI00259AC8F3|nr:hypothetical protein [Neopusillimonas aromaticivorans]WJJ93526.1 hypothetical protein N7E01_16655 [Neopusillimonas aromaticivorans]
MAHRKTVNTMWLDAVNLLERADQMHRQFFSLASNGQSGPTGSPQPTSSKHTTACLYRSPCPASAPKTCR